MRTAATQPFPRLPPTVAAASAGKPIAAAPPVTYPPSSPVHAPEFEALNDDETTDGSPNPIATYLQIPSSINDSKGSLSEFAAQITCLLWFESSLTLHLIEDAPSTPTPCAPLVEEAKPCMGFQKWVTTMLATTQVRPNVILLALLFIYRLKKQNPQVKGKPGSEYRLLTVALMLGNKFLDDNTYTNKTWADVSGIAVNEIHVMEVEFLSNMRYTLYTSDKEWARWSQKLGRFYDYFNRASRAPMELRQPLPLLSPPGSQQSSPLFRAYEPSTLSAGASAYLSSASSLPPMPRMPEVDLRPTSRKRSYDEAVDEPPAKRMQRPMATPNRLGRPRGLSDGPILSMVPEHTLPRLPMPAYSSAAYAQAPLYSSAPSPAMPTPPHWAMSTVYGHPSQPSAQVYSTLVPYLESSNLSRPQMAPVANPAQARPLQPMMVPSATGSPVHLAGTPQPELLSPHGYAINRSSPYRPVRSVHTLLVPPPSTSFQNPPLHLGAANMHYQPLGRPVSERRSGVVPYLHHNPADWAHYSPYRSQASPRW